MMHAKQDGTGTYHGVEQSAMLLLHHSIAALQIPHIIQRPLSSHARTDS